MLGLVIALGSSLIPSHAQSVLISEYVEGSSNNKALELYNPTDAPVDLSAEAYVLQYYFNGNPAAGLTISLTGTIATGGTYVVAQSAADATILAVADQTNGAGWFNGDDAVVLRRGGAEGPILDVIGQIGTDPGSAWGSGPTTTQNQTLRRRLSFCVGDNNPNDPFDPATEWEGLPTDTFDGLGNHRVDCGTGGGPTIVINEVDADTPGTDTAEFIELYDGGVGNTSLAGLVVVLYNGSNDATYATFNLSDYTTDADGYLVLGNATVPNVALTFGSNTLQNGADAVALYAGSAADFPSGTAVTTEGLVDALVYDTDDADDAGLLVLLNDGQPQVNEDENNDKDNQSLQRIPDGAGGLRNTEAYAALSPTPGAPNGDDGEQPPVTPDALTLIHTIQGTTDTSPLVGQTVRIKGLVVGDFQADDGDPFGTDLGGFYVQEEAADFDDDEATSEGIFVFASDVPDVAVGDTVTVTGSVTEFNGLTELTDVTDVTVAAGGPAPEPVTVRLPATEEFLERYESMHVRFTQPLVIAEYFNYDRFNEVVLTLPLDSLPRPFVPTSYVEPEAAAAISEALVTRRVILDDGRTTQNPDSLYHPNGDVFSNENNFRGGDVVENTTGVLSYGFGAFRIQPTRGADYTSVNPRPAAPEAVGGTLRVAAFNVLNYFTTLGRAGRGADDAEEFARQRAKIIAAIQTIDADIVGLIEIENNTEAIEDLVDGLNEATGAGTYAYINTGVIGTDQIKVAFVYKPATVGAVGDFAVLDTSVDPRFVDTRNRPALAQTFRELATNEILTVSVNHLKSKGSGCGAGDDDPQQGNCNGTRTRAAEALVDWLATDPTGSGDPDVMIIGDLNAYDEEDPITAIREGADDTAGTDDDYTDLVEQFQGEFGYSYVFDGQFGYLDYALVSQSLREQVTGATEWHINADEPDAFDYNTNFRPAGQQALYEPTPYRASDHDPVVVGLTLAPAEEFITLGDCSFTLADFPGAAEIIAAQPITFARVYYAKGSYVIGIATGIRTDGRAGVWEVHNDCSVKPVKRTGFLAYRTTLLPNVPGVERWRGWRYEPYAISDDGQYIYANAINEGYRRYGLEIEAGTEVAVQFQIGRPWLGRVLSVRGSVTCEPEAVRYFGRTVVLGCQDQTTTRSRDADPAKSDEVAEPAEAAPTVTAFPNPVNDRLTVSLTSRVADVASVVMYDMSGRVVMERQVPVAAGLNEIDLEANRCPRGPLLLRITLPTQGTQQVPLIKE